MATPDIKAKPKPKVAGQLHVVIDTLAKPDSLLPSSGLGEKGASLCARCTGKARDRFCTK